MTEGWNSKTDVKEQKQLPRVNDGGGGGGVGGGNGGFLRISLPLIFKKTPQKTKTQMKNLSYSEIIFGCCTIVVFLQP